MAWRNKTEFNWIQVCSVCSGAYIGYSIPFCSQQLILCLLLAMSTVFTSAENDEWNCVQMRDEMTLMLRLSAEHVKLFSSLGAIIVLLKNIQLYACWEYRVMFLVEVCSFKWACLLATEVALRVEDSVKFIASNETKENIISLSFVFFESQSFGFYI